MTVKKFSLEIENVLDSMLDDELALQIPKEIINVLSRFGDIVNHATIDVDRFLEESIEADHNSRLFDKILKQIGITRHVYEQLRNKMKDTIKNRSLEEFIIPKSEALSVFIKDVFDVIALNFIRIQKQNNSLKSELASLKTKVKKLEDDLSRECTNRDTMETYFSRDLQVILQYIQNDGHHSEQIEKVVTDSLADLGLEILWKINDRDSESHFFVETESDPNYQKVLRPCILKKGKILHQGIIGTPK